MVVSDIRRSGVLSPDHEEEVGQGQEAVWELVIQARRDTSLPFHYTQELFSLFILAIASNIDKVSGVTKYEPESAKMDHRMGRKARCWDNSVASIIAK